MCFHSDCALLSAEFAISMYIVPVCTIMAIVDADGRAVRPASSYIESAQYGTRKGV